MELTIISCECCAHRESCTKPQKTELKPCREIAPEHCGQVMKFQRRLPRISPKDEPMHVFSCLACKLEKTVGVTTPPEAPRKFLGDAIKPRMGKDDAPETGH